MWTRLGYFARETLVSLRRVEALQKVAWRAHTGLFHDETAELCQWHVPSTHYLEMWSDARFPTAAAMRDVVPVVSDGYFSTLGVRPARGRFGPSPSMPCQDTHWRS